MQLKYGTYTHALGEPALMIDRQTLFTEADTPWAEKVRWQIQGMLTNQGGTEATLDAKVAALEAAYASDYQDVALLLSSGAAAAGHSIANVDTLGGIRIVKRPSYPKGDGVEGVTVRTFSVVLEAELPIASETALLSWSETIRFTGGGAKYGHLEPLTGKPIKQLLKRNTLYQVTQQGRAVGLYAYPVIPSAFWPADQLDMRDVEYGSPKRKGYGSGADTYVEFPVSWTYRFASRNRMWTTSGPHRWNQ